MTNITIKNLYALIVSKKITNPGVGYIRMDWVLVKLCALIRQKQ